MFIKKILSRKPNQESYDDLVDDLLGLLNVDYQCYVWHQCPYGIGTKIEEIGTLDYNHDLTVWIVTDTLISLDEFDHSRERVPKVFLELEKICGQHPNKAFVLMTQQYNLEKIRTQHNLRVIDFLPDFDQDCYGYFPVKDKNVYNQRPVIFLNNSERQHRMASLSYFLTQRLDLHCEYSIGTDIQARARSFEHFWNYCSYQIKEKDWQWFEPGFQEIKNHDRVHNEVKSLYQAQANGNLENFRRYLVGKYQQSLIEIVSHSIFSEPTPHLTEKNLQNIYGRNLPLYLAPRGTVQYMRDQGFDMFDDVLDHGYDLIAEPEDRIRAMFDLNKILFQDPRIAKKTWLHCQHRLDKNIQHVPVWLDDFRGRVKKDFWLAVDQLMCIKTAQDSDRAHSP